MVSLSERRESLPILAGKSVIVIDSTTYAQKITHELATNYQMKTASISEHSFPANLQMFMSEGEYYSGILHIPTIGNDESREALVNNISVAYQYCPRIIVIEGHPVTTETEDAYRQIENCISRLYLNILCRE